jgi:hypothetical protein
MGDYFYILMVPMDCVINTHSMGNFCSYHPELKKPNCIAGLTVYVSVLLFGALKDINKTCCDRWNTIWHRAGPPP